MADLAITVIKPRLKEIRPLFSKQTVLSGAPTLAMSGMASQHTAADSTKNQPILLLPGGRADDPVSGMSFRIGDGRRPGLSPVFQ
jgi:hypothetical protein